MSTSRWNSEPRVTTMQGFLPSSAPKVLKKERSQASFPCHKGMSSQAMVGPSSAQLSSAQYHLGSWIYAKTMAGFKNPGRSKCSSSPINSGSTLMLGAGRAPSCSSWSLPRSALEVDLHNTLQICPHKHLGLKFHHETFTSLILYLFFLLYVVLLFPELEHIQKRKTRIHFSICP